MKKNLEVKNLRVAFKTQGSELTAVRGIDFYLAEGEAVGIVGESGCGKSAAAKALIRLLPTLTTRISGEIWFENQNILTCTEREMEQIRGKGIGMVLQNPASALNPKMTVGAQITEGYRKHFVNASKLEAQEEACRILSKVGMPFAKEMMSSYPHTLSCGMRQRALIVLALICKPKILLADEPTTALDETNQDQVLKLLKQYQKESGASILFITHDMRLVANFCDRVMVMYGGKIVESAPTDKLFQHPRHPYTKGLLNAIPQVNQAKGYTLSPIDGSPPNLALPLPYCSFCTRCSDAMNICAKESPPLFQVGDSHWSSCFKDDPRCNQ